jgi:Fuc2NAc and GlcNAc transferase
LPTFFLSFLASCLVTWLAILICRRFGVVDVPNERSSHKAATPRGGGVGIYLVVLVGVAWFWSQGLLDAPLALALLAGGCVVVAVGLADDLRGLPVLVRLPAHLGASGFAAWLILRPVLTFGLAGDVGLLLFGTLFVAWSLNIYNFMDGIDGIAGVQGAFAGLALFLGSAVSWLLGGDSLGLCLLGACLGFLVWNWHPAKIFMGDAASGFLGFAIGCFALASAVRSTGLFFTWLIVLGVFTADSSVTLVTRLLRGQKVYQAHRSHAYQHLAQKYGNHAIVSVVVAGICLFWLLPMAWLSVIWRGGGSASSFAIMAAALLPLVIGAIWAEAGRDRSKV